MSTRIRPLPVLTPETVLDPSSTPAGLTDHSLTDPQLYVNRELSLLEFQRRVLEEARDPHNPLLERVKFLSILGSNLDEFFMVRVAGLKHQVEAGHTELNMDGWTAGALLEEMRARIVLLDRQAYDFYAQELLPDLTKARIRIVDYASVHDVQRAALDAYFRETVFPVLTPLAFDPGRPFPHISNLSLNLAVLVRDQLGIERFARVKVPDTLPQLVPIRALTPAAGATESVQSFLWLEQLIAANLDELFPGLEIVEAHPFHVTRDADIAIQELEADDLLETIEEGVRQRRFGDVVRLLVDHGMPAPILDILMTNLEIGAADVYRVPSFLAVSRLRALLSLDRPDLKDKPFLPCMPPVLSLKPEEDIFGVIRREDVLVHHPFESFQPVVEFLRRAARDKDVLAIKITLYRVGRNSPVVEALLEAMANDKQVAVLVELRARFDEESNIEWARALEREGVHVVYGLLGLKIHSKVALVVRREGDAMRRYVHLATGNYNPHTAQLYTDLGFFTANEQIGADATDLFNYLTGYSAKADYRKLLVAPINMRERIEQLIEREIACQRRGERGHIIMKMNALQDEGVIRLLYEASQAGVQVDLLVRGICCLRPGIPGVSDHIRVTSVVGQFLEHSRIYYFRNAGCEEVFLGSADLMFRSLTRRVEVLFPIESPKLLRRVRDEILAVYLADQVKARRMLSDGTYLRDPRAYDDGAVHSQAVLMHRSGIARRRS